MLGQIARKFLGPWLGVHFQYAPRTTQLPDHYHEPVSLPTYPSISVVTPSYAQGEFLERTITSILNQKYPNLEYIIQDGGSTDQTTEILARYASQFHAWESAPDGGQANAINKGFTKSSGEIMAFVNSDDVLLPGALHSVAQFFTTNPQVDVVYGHRIIIDGEDKEVGRWIMPKHSDQAFIWTDYVPQETMFWRRRIWDKIGGHLDESFQSALDWDLLLRFEAARAKFYRLPRFLGAFRVHPQQKSCARYDDLGWPEWQLLRERWHGRRVSKWEARLRVIPYLCRHIITHRMYQLGLMA
ncbi:MAG: glycosyltransferase family 2 protein [Gemmataceae bacterium]